MSGISLFLASIASITGDAKLRSTALAAIANALLLAEDLPVKQRLGLYTGWTGIAIAAARIGLLLGEDALLREARKLISGAGDSLAACEDFDLISGKAGAVLGAIILSEALDAPSLVELAVRSGDALLESAAESRGTLSWRWPAFPRQPNLTGFSHGAAGPVLALAELCRQTGEPKYREASLKGGRLRAPLVR